MSVIQSYTQLCEVYHETRSLGTADTGKTMNNTGGGIDSSCGAFRVFVSVLLSFCCLCFHDSLLSLSLSAFLALLTMSLTPLLAKHLPCLLPRTFFKSLSHRWLRLKFSKERNSIFNWRDTESVLTTAGFQSSPQTCKRNHWCPSLGLLFMGVPALHEVPPIRCW